jgi:hypothetical protein
LILGFFFKFFNLCFKIVKNTYYIKILLANYFSASFRRRFHLFFLAAAERGDGEGGARLRLGRHARPLLAKVRVRCEPHARHTDPRAPMVLCRRGARSAWVTARH